MDGLWLTYADKALWETWLSRFPERDQDIYFTPEYTRLYATTDEEACCYIYSDGKNIFFYAFICSLVPYLTNHYDIITPYGYGGPISNTSDQIFLKAAFENFYQKAKEQKIIAEVIKFHPILQNASIFSPIYRGKIFDICQTVYVDLEHDKEKLWDNIYTHANKKNINKSLRNNFTVSFSREQHAWLAFKKLYTETMLANDADQSFLYPENYFLHIQKHLSEHYILATCQQDSVIVAVLLVLLGKRFAHCHLLGTDREAMKFGVNNLLHHELINWCARQGYELLHLGGGRGNSEDDPLLKFKKNFTDKQLTFCVGENILDAEHYELACKKWQTENPGRASHGRLLKYRF